MLVLGIDPGTANIGLCLYDTDKDTIKFFATVKAKRSESKDDRLFEMIDAMENQLLLEEIDIAFIEYPVVFKSAKASLAVAESLGWIKSLMYKMEIQVNEVNVMDIKRLAKAMKKEDIIKKATDDCEIKGWIVPSTEHEADAYWIMKTGLIKILLGKDKNGKAIKKKDNKSN